MPKFTDFLKLTLGEFKEFVNSWHKPVNQNFEKIDDWTQDVYNALVGSGSSSDFADLIGSKASLAERLAVSINEDGTLDPTNSPDILNMSTSAYTGAFTSPRDRLDDGDGHLFDARQPFAGGRFAPLPAAGPSASYPGEDLDSGIALRTRGFSSHPLRSPNVPWAPGLVTGGATPLMSGLGIGQVRITADSPAAVFNIDGYAFRIREIIDLDWTVLSPSNGDWVWIFVERTEGQYGSSSYKYTAPGGGTAAAKDLRRLQSGSDGVTSNSTFSSASALFNTKPLGKVRPGDLLVITSGAAAGSYVIDALDGTTPDTKFTIKGKFKSNITGASWYVLDNAHPNIGAVVTAVDTLPAFAVGRVYIGRAVHNSAGAPTDLVTFRAGGVYDSGWITVDTTTDFPLALTHNLGAVPTDLEVWCRASSAADEIYPAQVLRTIVTDTAGPSTADFMVPALRIRSSDLEATLTLQNASTVPLKPAAVFTDSAGTDYTSCQIRVIARK